MLSRRDLLRATGAAGLAVGFHELFRAPAAVAADAGPKKKVLVFTRSQGFEHSVVKPGKDGKPSLVDRVLTDLASKHNFEVTCTKDGRVFTPEEVKKFDAFFFETTGDLTAEGGDKHPPMPKEGKQAFLDAIKAGKGFVGAHCATDTFHSSPQRWVNQPTDKQDPYIAMIGGEFIRHGAQQQATMRLVDKAFPGLKGESDFRINEEWYALKNFAPDLHVILAQETKGMTNYDYQRPDFPATWARLHGKGRVFYTSMGHREDVWESPRFQALLAGALAWALGRVEADLTPNMATATPKGMEVPAEPPPAPKKPDAPKKAAEKK